MSLGFDWAPGNLSKPEGGSGQGGSGGPQRHDMADFSRSVHPACFFLFFPFPFFFIHIGTHTNAHTSDWAPHRDNSQRFVMARQEGPIVRLNQLLYRKQSLQLKLFAVKLSVS